MWPKKEVRYLQGGLERVGLRAITSLITALGLTGVHSWASLSLDCLLCLSVVVFLNFRLGFRRHDEL
jgi:hypothetical protein